MRWPGRGRSRCTTTRRRLRPYGPLSMHCRGQTPDPDEWPEFVQPTGAHDAYGVGAQVTYNGQRYRCKLANCVWSPDAYPDAWELVET